MLLPGSNAIDSIDLFFLPVMNAVWVDVDCIPCLLPGILPSFPSSVALFPTMFAGIGLEGVESLSSPSAIISKNPVLEVKFRPIRWSVASKGLVRRGVLEQRTMGQNIPAYRQTTRMASTIHAKAGPTHAPAIRTVQNIKVDRIPPIQFIHPPLDTIPSTLIARV